MTKVGFRKISQIAVFEQHKNMVYPFFQFSLFCLISVWGVFCVFAVYVKAAEYPQPIPEWNPMGTPPQAVNYFVPDTMPQPTNSEDREFLSRRPATNGSGFSQESGNSNYQPRLWDSQSIQPEVEQNETVREYFKQSRKKYRLCKPLLKEVQKYKESLASFYKLDTAMNYGLALGLGAVLANTACDDNFANWYQNDIRSDFTDDFGRFSKVFGEGSLLIPTVLVTSFVYRYMDEYWDLRGSDAENVGQWASRSSRAIFVGFPPLLLGQYIIGASRPGEDHHGSYWRSFSDVNGISGHAFMGAIPFITAAQMTDNIGFKSLLYAGSTFTAWSRVNDNHHYLSQVILGWYLAYLSCKAVTRTENPNFGRGLTVFPLVTADTVGIGIIYRR